MTQQEKLLQLAEKTVRKTRAVIPYCANRHDDAGNYYRKTLLIESIPIRGGNGLAKLIRKNPISPIGNDITDNHLSINGENIHYLDLLKNIRENQQNNPVKKNHKNGDLNTALDKVENTARIAARLGVGNCTEQAFFACALLLERDFVNEFNFENTINAEIIGIGTPGDHVFVVINRAQDSQLNKIETWGDAIVIDPWAKTWFVIKEQYQKFCDGNDDIDGMFHYIFAHIEYAQVLGQPYQIGQGHSQRWQEKNRTNLSAYSFFLPPVDEPLIKQVESPPCYQEPPLPPGLGLRRTSGFGS